MAVGSVGAPGDDASLAGSQTISRTSKTTGPQCRWSRRRGEQEREETLLRRLVPSTRALVDPLPKTGANLLIRLKVAQVETRGGARVEDKTRAKLNAALPGQVFPLACDGEGDEKGQPWPHW